MGLLASHGRRAWELRQTLLRYPRAPSPPHARVARIPEASTCLPVRQVNIIPERLHDAEFVVFFCVLILGCMSKASSHRLLSILKLFNGAFVVKFKGVSGSDLSDFRYGSGFICCLKWLSFPRDDKNIPARWLVIFSRFIFSY